MHPHNNVDLTMMSKNVSTTNPSSFNEGRGNFFVMSPNVRRTYASHAGAIDHAANLIYAENADEFLIVKVVGRVRKKRPPLEYVSEE
jgi:hypothetical protein